MTTAPARRARATSARKPGPLRRRWDALSPRTRKILVAVPLAGLALFTALVATVYFLTDIPRPEDIRTDQTTIVSFADGSPLVRLRGEQNRTDIPLEDVPEHARDAVLAAEDRGYYDHGGISLRGIARAAYQDVFGGGPTQGGSTITQQYARNKFLTRDRTFARKFREAIVAVKLDRTYSKDQVLEWYLNTIYFGRGAYGIEAASLTYFGVPAKRLNVEQSALLAALIRAPEGGDPARAPEVAERRWRSVLDGMVAKGWLEESKAAQAKFPRVRPRGDGKALTGPNGYIGDAVLEELRAKGFNASEVYRSGLRVTTTIRKPAQEAARTAVETVLDDPARDPNAALVSVEPGTGRIVAMYGGRDFAKREFNFATDARRQPGSAFKPVVLAAALDDGISLRSRYDGRSPQSFNGYEVENYDDEQFGQIDLVTATANSVNTVYVPLGLEAGAGDVVDAMHRLGVPERVECNRDAAMFLGACEQRPLDMAAVFATFAAQGERATPYLVEKITSADGDVLYQAKPKAEREFDEGVMADATFAMREVVERGTATRARIGRPAAGKTGTTTNNIDAWFAGYVPQLSTVVWMGYDPVKGDDGKLRPRPLRDVQGVPSVTGGSLPARIWRDFMEVALRGVPVKDFPPPRFGGKADVNEASASPSASPSGLPTPSLTAVPTPTRTGPSEEPTESRSPIVEPSPSKSKDPDPSPSESEVSSPEPSPAASP